MLKVNEIFYSIQGESTNAGLPCVFIRLTGCNIRCDYCDTQYAFAEGEEYSIEEVVEKVKSFNCDLVELTGGEPLLQKESNELINVLLKEGFDVMLETNGTIDISKVDERVKIILDFKGPSSKMSDKNLFENVEYLKKTDEVKFVIADKTDFEWAKNIVSKYDLDKKAIVLFSPSFGNIAIEELVKWILKDNLKVRFQMQIHKYIWNPDMKGV